jgi:DNA-binding MarR family transcriptional regulator
VPPEIVTACFYNFHPSRVARAVPDVWLVAAPEVYLDIRLSATDAALRRLVGEAGLRSAEVAEAAELARQAALAAPVPGRPLGAANAALPWPEPPHLALWHAQTVLRETRGDGHIAALLTAGLDPCEALVLFAADTEDLDPTWLRERRGWSEPEWAAASKRLAERGLLDGDGLDAGLTDAGRATRDEVERHTDELSAAPWERLGERRSERLVELVRPLVRAIVDGGAFLPANPMGLRPLR